MCPKILLACVVAGFLCGCTVRAGTEKESSTVSIRGLANGYVSVHGIRPYDGTFVELGILRDSERSGEFEVASAEFWPLLGLGVGLAGARMQLLPLDAGVGVLAYNPRPPKWHESKETPQAPEPAEPEEATPADEVGEEESPDA